MIPFFLNSYKPIGAGALDRTFEALCLKKLSDVLVSLNLKHWIDFGTLLGSIRDKKVIDWDVDLDMGCIVDSNDHWWGQTQISLLSHLQKDFYIKYFWKERFVSLLPRIDTGRFGLNHIDLYFWKQEGKELKSELLPNMSFRSFFLDELEISTLYTLEFPRPRHIESFLEMRYGIDWKTPDPGFSVETNIIKNKSAYVCYTSMVGDFFHVGHQNLLRRCKELFDKVIVGVHNDEDVETYKARPYTSYKERLKTIKECPYVDEVYENAPVITTVELINNLEVDFVVAGREEKEKINKMYPIPEERMHLIERTSGISSSQIRKSLKDIN